MTRELTHAHVNIYFILVGGIIAVDVNRSGVAQYDAWELGCFPSTGKSKGPSPPKVILV